MRFKKEKLIKIMNELVNFCLQIKMEELDIKFICKENEEVITVSGYAENPPLDRLNDLETILNAPRQQELEEYYWGLVGNGCGYQELEMVGILVDSGRIDYKDKILTIHIERRED